MKQALSVGVAQPIDPKLLEISRGVTSKRPRTVLDHLIKHGYITTEELQTVYGYDHPPRAVRDVRECGIPIETFKVQSERTGRMIAAYRFGDPALIRRGRVGGRRAFSKAFKEQLLAHYGSADTITSERLDSRYLQIDHRVPYEIAGDTSYDETDLQAYMLLDASSQRAKSWSCEHCRNFVEFCDPNICRSCYWASPEDYTHVATEPIRRTDLVWSGPEVRQYEHLQATARRLGRPLPDTIKKLLPDSD